MTEQESMRVLTAEIADCRRCDLWKYAKNPVPGDGEIAASLMFIGEAPGYREDVEGKPFVGAAGKILDELLASVNIKRDDVYITNVVKHRPPRNRDPKEYEVESCSPYLDRQIQIVRPQIIVPLGRHSARYVLSRLHIRMDGITEVRGKIYKWGFPDFQVTILPTFHPAAAIYNPRCRNLLEEDFAKLKRLVQSIS